MVDLRQRIRGAGDHRRVKTKEQSSESAHDRAFHNMKVNGHFSPLFRLDSFSM